MRRSTVQESRIIRNAFYLQLGAYVFSQMTRMIGSIVDGVMIGRFLGVDSIAAFGIVSPALVVFSIFGMLISIGSRNLFTRFIGEGKLDEARGIFSLSLIVSAAGSVMLMTVTLAFATPIAALLGASGNAAHLLPKARDYLIGISIGLPALNLIHVMNNYFPIDNDRRLPVYSSITLTVTDILMDVLMIFAFHGDMFEMGLATSISYYAAFAVLLLHFRKKEIILHPSFRHLSWGELPRIAAKGLPSSICLVGYLVTVAFMNRLLAVNASASAIAAYSVCMQAQEILCILTVGIGDTTAVIAGILLGEENRPQMKKLLKTSVRATLIITLASSAVSFFGAHAFSSLYIVGNAEALRLSIRAIRAYAVGIPLYGLSLVYFNYFQGIGKTALSSVCSFLSEVVTLILSALVLSVWFKEDAPWFAFPVAQILMFLIYTCLVVTNDRKNRGKRSFWDKILLLPDSFDVPESDRIDISISTIEEITEYAQIIGDFCLSHGCESRRANHMRHAVDEMAGNVFEHGFSKDNKKHTIDVRAVKKGDDYILRIRDDCYIFDPVHQLQLLYPDDLFRNIGVRLIMKTAKDVQYTSILKLNNLVVRI